MNYKNQYSLSKKMNLSKRLISFALMLLSILSVFISVLVIVLILFYVLAGNDLLIGHSLIENNTNAINF